MNNLELDWKLVIKKVTEINGAFEINTDCGEDTLTLILSNNKFITFGLENADVGFTVASFSGCIFTNGEIFDCVEFPTNKDRVDFIIRVSKKTKEKG